MTDATDPSYLVGDLFFAQDALSARELDSVLEIRGFFEREVRPIADECWAEARFPTQLILPMAALGLYGAAWPETCRFENSAAYRGWTAFEMARVDASVSGFVGIQSWLVMGAIGVGGSPSQRAEWLPQLGSGDLVGAFALTEPQSGSDVARGLATTATRTGRGTWRLDGAKRWIGNGTFADLVVVWARDTDDGQAKGFLVAADSPGFTAMKIERKQSFRSVQNADITLDGVEVPEERRLQGVDSFRDIATVLKLSRPDVAWQAVGNAMGAYEAAVAYVAGREQFGRPLASFQLVQDLLARALENITASIALCLQTSALADSGRLTDAHASLAKSFATTRARETVAWCREVCGGNGIVLETGVARPFADAEGLYSFEGTREMNSLIVGRAITGVGAFR